MSSEASSSCCGSGASGSWSVSSSETWSPEASETAHSSSSATTVELEIWISDSWNSSTDDVELARHLLVGRRPVQLVLELAVDALDLAGAGAHRARHPVQRAQLVDDRALDAGDRVGLELDLAVEVEALDRVDQADQAVGDEVGLLDVRGQAGRHAAGDVLDQRRVGDDELLARTVGAAALVAAPEVPQLDRFDVGFQCQSPPRPADGCVRTPTGAARTLPECRSGSWRCAWPSSSWMARRSAPPSSRWVAKECRSACGCTAPCAAACRAHTRRRRRTSDVESRRPDLERNSAGSLAAPRQRGPGALEVARDGAQRRLADGHEARLGALALHAQLLGVELDASRRRG